MRVAVDIILGFIMNKWMLSQVVVDIDYILREVGLELSPDYHV